MGQGETWGSMSIMGRGETGWWLVHAMSAFSDTLPR